MDRKTVYISHIQRFSVDDGPGVRTTIFLKGCRLRCLWCHNPECISGCAQLQYFDHLCSRCGRCATVCPQSVHSIQDGRHLIERGCCQQCRACERVCPGGALRIVGQVQSPEEVLEIIKRDEPYYRKSGGGMTVSGGEPMLHLDYLRRLLSATRRAGISTAVDTAGDVPYMRFVAVAPLVDIFLYDLKIFDLDRHQAVTGVSNKRILKNLERLSSDGARLIVRIPVVPEISTTPDLERLAEFLAPLSVELTQLLPYHSYGLGKYASLGLESGLAELRQPTPEFLENALSLFTAVGIKASIN